MGSAFSFPTSPIHILNLYGTNIHKLDDDKVIFKKNVDDSILSILYFDDDIATECYQILSKLGNSDQPIHVYYYTGKIVVIYEHRYQPYSSSCVRPSSIGWALCQ